MDNSRLDLLISKTETVKFFSPIQVPVYINEIVGAGSLVLLGAPVWNEASRIRCTLLNEVPFVQSFVDGDEIKGQVYGGGHRSPYVITETEMQISCDENGAEGMVLWGEESFEIINEAMREYFEITSCLSDLIAEGPSRYRTL